MESEAGTVPAPIVVSQHKGVQQIASTDLVGRLCSLPKLLQRRTNEGELGVVVVEYMHVFVVDLDAVRVAPLLQPLRTTSRLLRCPGNSFSCG